MQPSGHGPAQTLVVRVVGGIIGAVLRDGDKYRKWAVVFFFPTAAFLSLGDFGESTVAVGATRIMVLILVFLRRCAQVCGVADAVTVLRTHLGNTTLFREPSTVV